MHAEQKRAVIVVGTHHAGKSKTIRKFFKPLVGLREGQRMFTLGGCTGAVLSQSLEERQHDGVILSQSLEEKGIAAVETFLQSYRDFKILVLAARPPQEAKSYYRRMKAELARHGFKVSTVEVMPGKPDSFYQARANEILLGVQ